MKKINSTITLRLSAVGGATLRQAEDLLKKMLRESSNRQNAAVKANLSLDCTGFTTFSSAASRTLSLPIPHSLGRLSGSRTDEMDRSEVYRILGSYQKRLKLAQFLRSTKWIASFEDCKAALGWVDYQLYKNVLRARKLPTVPRISSAIIPLSKSDRNFCVLSHIDGTIILENFALWDKRADLVFKIPAKLAQLHPNPSKITRPNIRLLDGEVVFDFVFQERVKEETSITHSVLGIDLGVERVFTAARVYSDGTFSEELIPSVFTDRQSQTAEKLLDEIRLISMKNRRRAILGVRNSLAISQELTLRAKKKRILEAQDWSVAADIIAHSKSGEQITIEQLNFSLGGKPGFKRFRSASMSSKLEHVANRRGKNVKRINAKNSSHECPKCHAIVHPDTDRMTHCKCGWSSDRDYTAAIVIGQRGLKSKKLKLKKNCPTPKRPRTSVRRSHLLPKRNTVWTAFTGAAPAEATGLSLAPTATSVIGILPFNCPSNLTA